MKENIPNLVGFKISRPFLNSILNFGTFLGSFDQLKSGFYQHDSYKVVGIRAHNLLSNPSYTGLVLINQSFKHSIELMSSQ